MTRPLLPAVGALAAASDRAVVERQILRYSHARHFILEADWTYVVPARDKRMEESFPLYLYDDKWWNDLRDVNLQTIKLSLAVLRGNPLWIKSWGKIVEEGTYRTRYEAVHSAASIAKFAAVIARHKVSVDAPSTLTCDAMDTIGGGLVPFVRALSQRGARVDLVVPPYSWILYYQAGEPGDSFHRPALLNDVLLMRRCLVQAVERIPGVRVFAFDDESAISGDFRNYMDFGHLYNPGANRYMLQSIATGEHRLTPDNIEARNAELRSNVIHYQLTGDTIEIPRQ
jgi:hypothetical protein